MTKAKNNFFKRVLADSIAERPEVAPVAEPAAEVSSTPVACATDASSQDTQVTREGGGFMGRLVRTQNANMMEEVEAATRERDAALAELARLHREQGGNLLSVDPACVAPSPYERRLPIAYTDKPFLALADDIKRDGGNHTPVLVRKYTGPHTDQFQWEVIAGHRRREACLAAQVEMIVLAREATNEDVVRLMASENAKREQESCLELGLHFRKLLMEGTAKSERHVAEMTDTPRSTVKRYLKMTEIDPIIIDAFMDPREIRVDWVQLLLNAWQSDGEGVRARIEALRGSNAAPSSLAVFRAVINAEKTATVKPQTLRVGERVIAKIQSDATGRAAIQFTKYAPADLIDQVLATTRAWHKRATGDDEGTST